MRKRPLIAAALALAVTATTASVIVFGSTSASALVIGGYDFDRPAVANTGLQVPWGMDFLPDGSALVAERNTARVMQVRPGQTPVQVATINGVSATGEAGLLGLAVSPNFASDNLVYVYFTSASDNRIVRFRLDTPQTQTPILTGLARASIHDGGRIAFGPDGMLYAGVGDAGTTSNSQNQNSLNGKILRMTPTGGVPAGNPFNNLVYSLGHRNVQGLAWDSQGRLWASEFGQNTWDELNQIVAGGNYGWPTVEGMGNNPAFRNPARVWTTAEASPSGIAIANNTVFMAALRGTRIWGIPINGDGSTGNPVAELQGEFGRLRTVELGPDGQLWIATSNRDGRGSPVAADDRIIRIPPAGQQTTTSNPPGVPGAPSAPTANIVLPNSIGITWAPPTGTVTNYQVERATGATSTAFTLVQTTTGTSHTSNGLTPNTTYRFRVRATNASGPGPYSPITNITTTSNQTTTTTTTSTTTTTTTSTNPPVGGCTATYAQQGQAWPGAFQGGVTVRNTGTNATTSWTVTVTFSAGQRITQIWGGRTNTSGNSPYTVTNETYNGSLPANGTTTFGFLASWNNSSNPAPTVTCTRTP